MRRLMGAAVTFMVAAGLLATAAASGNERVVMNERYPLVLLDRGTCDGQIIARMEGSGHALITSTELGNGDVRFFFHVNERATGVAPDGTEYTWIRRISRWTVSQASGATDENAQILFKNISQGPADNTQIVRRQRLTTNASGETVVDWVTEEQHCRG